MNHLTDPEFYTDPFGGDGVLITDAPDRRVWVRHDEATGLWEQCVVQPVTDILDANQELYNAAGTRWGDMALVASIPNALYWHGDFAKARAAQDDKWLKRFLNSSENLKLRTRPGNV